MIAGLYLGEVVLLVLGVALFIVLLGALRRALAAGKSYAGLLPFFLVTIAMIGYPSIKSIQYKSGMVEIDKDTEAVESSSTDPQAAREAALRLQENAKKYQDRANAADREKINHAMAAVKEWQHRNTSANSDQEGVAVRERVLKMTAELSRADAPGKEGGNPQQAAARKKELRDQLSQAVAELERQPGNPENAEAITNAKRLLGSQ